MSVTLTAAAVNDGTVYTEGTLYYTINNDSITITGCFGKNTVITVPASIAGYPVNTIASGAFSSNAYLEELNLPDTITKIESGAIADGIKVIYNCNTPYPSLVVPEILRGGTDLPTDPVPSDSDNQGNTGTTDDNDNHGDSDDTSDIGVGGEVIKEDDLDIDDEDNNPADTEQQGEKDPVTPISFDDVPDGTWYTDAVLWAVDNGITNGIGNNLFGPLSVCNRAQIVTFLWRAAGQPKATGSNPFTDVKQDDYFYDAVLWAVENGVTTGTSEITFAPGASCTRAQIVTFLWRASGKPESDGAQNFVDVESGSYYEKAVTWAVNNNITLGTDADHFSPSNNCNRAQAVTFLYRTFVEK